MIFSKYKIWILGIIIFILIACNQAERHNILTLFFDGVPNPARESSVKTDSLVADKDTQKQVSDDQETTISETFLSAHPAYRPNQCNQCHEVTRSYRLNQRQPALCYQCHPDFKTKYKKLHGPVAGGYCTACHLPHQSKYKYLLKHPARENCQYCHHAGDVAKNSAHEAISEIECMQCHNPHGGEDKFFLINQ